MFGRLALIKKDNDIVKPTAHGQFDGAPVVVVLPEAQVGIGFMLEEQLHGLKVGLIVLGLAPIHIVNCPMKGGGTVPSLEIRIHFKFGEDEPQHFGLFPKDRLVSQGTAVPYGFHLSSVGHEQFGRCDMG